MKQIPSNVFFLLLMSLSTALPGCVSKKHIAEIMTKLYRDLLAVGTGYTAQVFTDIEVSGDTLLPATTTTFTIDPGVFESLGDIQQAGDSTLSLTLKYDTIAFSTQLTMPLRGLHVTASPSGGGLTGELHGVLRQDDVTVMVLRRLEA